MKMNSKLRRILLTVCSAALLVCVTVGATVAYLTSTDEVKNTFTVGKVAITLDEAAIKQDPASKNWVEDDTQSRVKANTDKLLPGITYAKDPTVTVKAGSEKAYVRVLVTINKRDVLDQLFKDNNIAISSVVDVNAKWTVASNKTEDTSVEVDGEMTVEKNRIYELRYDSIVDAATADKVLEDVFTKITVPGNLENDDIKNLDNLKIDVVAQAIQADGFASADAAWAAFAGN